MVVGYHALYETVPYHRVTNARVWPRIFVSLVQLFARSVWGNTLSARGLWVQLRFPKCTMSWGAYLKVGMLNAEMTWNDWSLLNFGRLGKCSTTGDHKKANGSLAENVLLASNNGWLGGVSFLVIVFSPSWCIFNGIFVNLWVVDILQPRERSKASYGHHRPKARPVASITASASSCRIFSAWCCWPHCVTWVKRLRKCDELVARNDETLPCLKGFHWWRTSKWYALILWHVWEQDLGTFFSWSSMILCCYHSLCLLFWNICVNSLSLGENNWHYTPPPPYASQQEDELVAFVLSKPLICHYRLGKSEPKVDTMMNRSRWKMHSNHHLPFWHRPFG